MKLIISSLFALFICGTMGCARSLPGLAQTSHNPKNLGQMQPSSLQTHALFADATVISQVKTPDGNIAELKAKFAGIDSVARPFLKRASDLKFTDLGAGPEITYNECVTYSQKIASNYKLSPFNAVYDGGSSVFGFCTDEYGRSETEMGAKFYFMDLPSLKNQFGIEARYLLSKIAPNLGWGARTQSRINVLLDGQFRMLEISSVDFVQDESKGISYAINSIDASGNYFRNVYFGPGDTGNAHYIVHQKYVSSDGTQSFQQDLNPRRGDKGSGQVLSNFYQVANGKTWDDFFIVLSHAWFSGFYDISGKIGSFPRAYSVLNVVSVNGKEVCSEGSSSTLTDWTRFPSPTASFGYCMNDW